MAAASFKAPTSSTTARERPTAPSPIRAATQPNPFSGFGGTIRGMSTHPFPLIPQLLLSVTGYQINVPAAAYLFSPAYADMAAASFKAPTSSTTARERPTAPSSIRAATQPNPFSGFGGTIRGMSTHPFLLIPQLLLSVTGYQINVPAAAYLFSPAYADMAAASFKAPTSSTTARERPTAPSPIRAATQPNPFSGFGGTILDMSTHPFLLIPQLLLSVTGYQINVPAVAYLFSPPLFVSVTGYQINVPAAGYLFSPPVLHSYDQMAAASFEAPTSSTTAHEPPTAPSPIRAATQPNPFSGFGGTIRGISTHPFLLIPQLFVSVTGYQINVPAAAYLFSPPVLHSYDQMAAASFEAPTSSTTAHEPPTAPSPIRAATQPNPFSGFGGTIRGISTHPFLLIPQLFVSVTGYQINVPAAAYLFSPPVLHSYNQMAAAPFEAPTSSTTAHEPPTAPSAIRAATQPNPVSGFGGTIQGISTHPFLLIPQLFVSVTGYQINVPAAGYLFSPPVLHSYHQMAAASFEAPTSSTTAHEPPTAPSPIRAATQPNPFSGFGGTIRGISTHPFLLIPQLFVSVTGYQINVPAAAYLFSPPVLHSYDQMAAASFEAPTSSTTAHEPPTAPSPIRAATQPNPFSGFGGTIRGISTHPFLLIPQLFVSVTGYQINVPAAAYLFSPPVLHSYDQMAAASFEAPTSSTTAHEPPTAPSPIRAATQPNPFSGFGGTIRGISTHPFLLIPQLFVSVTGYQINVPAAGYLFSPPVLHSYDQMAAASFEAPTSSTTAHEPPTAPSPIRAATQPNPFSGFGGTIRGISTHPFLLIPQLFVSVTGYQINVPAAAYLFSPPVLHSYDQMAAASFEAPTSSTTAHEPPTAPSPIRAATQPNPFSGFGGTIRGISTHPFLLIPQLFVSVTGYQINVPAAAYLFSPPVLHSYDQMAAASFEAPTSSTTAHEPPTAPPPIRAATQPNPFSGFGGTIRGISTHPFLLIPQLFVSVTGYQINVPAAAYLFSPPVLHSYDQMAAASFEAPTSSTTAHEPPTAPSPIRAATQPNPFSGFGGTIRGISTHPFLLIPQLFVSVTGYQINVPAAGYLFSPPVLHSYDQMAAASFEAPTSSTTAHEPPTAPSPIRAATQPNPFSGFGGTIRGISTHPFLLIPQLFVSVTGYQINVPAAAYLFSPPVLHSYDQMAAASFEAPTSSTTAHEPPTAPSPIRAATQPNPFSGFGGTIRGISTHPFLLIPQLFVSVTGYQINVPAAGYLFSPPVLHSYDQMAAASFEAPTSSTTAHEPPTAPSPIRAATQPNPFSGFGGTIRGISTHPFLLIPQLFVSVTGYQINVPAAAYLFSPPVLHSYDQMAAASFEAPTSSTTAHEPPTAPPPIRAATQPNPFSGFGGTIRGISTHPFLLIPQLFVSVTGYQINVPAAGYLFSPPVLHSYNQMAAASFEAPTSSTTAHEPPTAPSPIRAATQPNPFSGFGGTIRGISTHPFLLIPQLFVSVTGYQINVPAAAYLFSPPVLHSYDQMAAASFEAPTSSTTAHEPPTAPPPIRAATQPNPFSGFGGTIRGISTHPFLLIPQLFVSVTGYQINVPAAGYLFSPPVLHSYDQMAAASFEAPTSSTTAHEPPTAPSPIRAATQPNPFSGFGGTIRGISTHPFLLIPQLFVSVTGYQINVPAAAYLFSPPVLHSYDQMAAASFEAPTSSTTAHEPPTAPPPIRAATQPNPFSGFGGTIRGISTHPFLLIPQLFVSVTGYQINVPAAAYLFSPPVLHSYDQMAAASFEAPTSSTTAHEPPTAPSPIRAATQPNPFSGFGGTIRGISTHPFLLIPQLFVSVTGYQINVPAAAYLFSPPVLHSYDQMAAASFEAPTSSTTAHEPPTAPSPIRAATQPNPFSGFGGTIRGISTHPFLLIPQLFVSVTGYQINVPAAGYLFSPPVLHSYDQMAAASFEAPTSSTTAHEPPTAPSPIRAATQPNPFSGFGGTIRGISTHPFLLIPQLFVSVTGYQINVPAAAYLFSPPVLHSYDQMAAASFEAPTSSTTAHEPPTAPSPIRAATQPNPFSGFGGTIRGISTHPFLLIPQLFVSVTGYQINVPAAGYLFSPPVLHSYDQMAAASFEAPTSSTTAHEPPTAPSPIRAATQPNPFSGFGGTIRGISTHPFLLIPQLFVSVTGYQINVPAAAYLFSPPVLHSYDQMAAASFEAPTSSTTAHEPPTAPPPIRAATQPNPFSGFGGTIRGISTHPFLLIPQLFVSVTGYQINVPAAGYLFSPPVLHSYDQMAAASFEAPTSSTTAHEPPTAPSPIRAATQPNPFSGFGGTIRGISTHPFLLIPQLFVSVTGYQINVPAAAYLFSPPVLHSYDQMAAASFEAPTSSTTAHEPPTAPPPIRAATQPNPFSGFGGTIRGISTHPFLLIPQLFVSVTGYQINVPAAGYLFSPPLFVSVTGYQINVPAAAYLFSPPVLHSYDQMAAASFEAPTSSTTAHEPPTAPPPIRAATQPNPFSGFGGTIRGISTHPFLLIPQLFVSVTGYQINVPAAGYLFSPPVLHSYDQMAAASFEAPTSSTTAHEPPTAPSPIRAATQPNPFSGFGGTIRGISTHPFLLIPQLFVSVTGYQINVPAAAYLFSPPVLHSYDQMAAASFEAPTSSTTAHEPPTAPSPIRAATQPNPFSGFGGTIRGISTHPFLLIPQLFVSVTGYQINVPAAAYLFSPPVLHSYDQMAAASFEAPTSSTTAHEPPTAPSPIRAATQPNPFSGFGGTIRGISTHPFLLIPQLFVSVTGYQINVPAAAYLFSPPVLHSYNQMAAAPFEAPTSSTTAHEPPTAPSAIRAATQPNPVSGFGGTIQGISTHPFLLIPQLFVSVTGYQINVPAAGYLFSPPVLHSYDQMAAASFEAPTSSTTAHEPPTAPSPIRAATQPNPFSGFGGTIRGISTHPFLLIPQLFVSVTGYQINVPAAAYLFSPPVLHSYDQMAAASFEAPTSSTTAHEPPTAPSPIRAATQPNPFSGFGGTIRGISTHPFLLIPQLFVSVTGYQINVPAAGYLFSPPVLHSYDQMAAASFEAPTSSTTAHEPPTAPSPIRAATQPNPFSGFGGTIRGISTHPFLLIPQLFVSVTGYQINVPAAAYLFSPPVLHSYDQMAAASFEAPTSSTTAHEPPTAPPPIRAATQPNPFSGFGGTIRGISTHPFLLIPQLFVSVTGYQINVPAAGYLFSPPVLHSYNQMAAAPFEAPTSSTTAHEPPTAPSPIRAATQPNPFSGFGGTIRGISTHPFLLIPQLFVSVTGYQINVPAAAYLFSPPVLHSYDQMAAASFEAPTSSTTAHEPPTAPPPIRAATQPNPFSGFGGTIRGISTHPFLLIPQLFVSVTGYQINVPAAGYLFSPPVLHS
ncbi:uncharacterized protein ISCGN_031884 [Ixodes scapularis]